MFSRFTFLASRSCPHRHSFETVMWCWDYLDGTHDGTQWRTFKIWQTGVWLPRTSLLNKFSWLLNLPPAIWSGPSLCFSLPSTQGISFQLHPGSFLGCGATVLQETSLCSFLLTQQVGVRGRTRELIIKSLVWLFSNYIQHLHKILMWSQGQVTPKSEWTITMSH